MSPVKTPECNFTFTAPKGVTNCNDLPCLRQSHSTTSFWKPDANELAYLIAGGTVAMTCYGQGHPVVGLGVMPAEKPDDVNDTAWQRDFIVPIAKIMKARGVAALTIRFSDHGNPFNPLDRDEVDTDKPIEEREIGGLGIHFIKNLTDSQSYEYKDGMNILTLNVTFTTLANVDA
jgi:hypothetical protein